MWPSKDNSDAHTRLYNHAASQRDKLARLRQMEIEKEFSLKGENVRSEHEAKEAAERLYYDAKVKRDRIAQKRDLERAEDVSKHVRLSISEREALEASNRLYQQGLMKRDKIEQLQESRNEENNQSSESSSVVMNEFEAEMTSSRLYNQSLEMQAEGRRRRLEIEKKQNSRRAPSPRNNAKISLDKANNIYERGMIQKLQMEIKQEEARVTKEFFSPLLDPLVTDRSKIPIKTLADKNTSISRIRPRSRIRSGTPSRNQAAKASKQITPVPLPPTRNPSHRSRTPSRSSSSSQTMQGFSHSQYARRSRSSTPVRRRIPDVRTRSPTPVRGRD